MKPTVVLSLITTYAMASFAIAAETPAETTKTAPPPAEQHALPLQSAPVVQPAPAAPKPHGLPPPYSPTGSRLEFSGSTTSNNLIAANSNRLVTMTRFFRLTDKQQEGIRTLQSARVTDEVMLKAARHELSRMPRSSTNRTEIAAKSKALTDQLETMLVTFERNCKVLLTPEQAAKWPGFDTYFNILISLKDCRFTPEQDAKIQELCVESSKQKETVPPGGIPPLRRLEQEIREKVQTDKQREESISLTVNQEATRRFRMADLTTEQETMIQKMVNDMLPQFVAARSEPKAYYELRTRLFDEIRAQVLTQEQRARTAPVKGTSAPFPAPPPTASKTDAPPSSKPEAAATPATEHTTPTKP